MSDAQPRGATEVLAKANPFDTLHQTAYGHWLARCLHVVAYLGVADALDEETPRSASDLAAAVGTHPDPLGRVLRLLAAHGIFEIQGSDTFGHSAASRLLRTDHPQSMRASVQLPGLPIIWASCGEMEHSVRTGLPAAAEVFPGGFWQYLTQYPEEGRVFNAAMAARAQEAIAGILVSYDFSGFGLIGDIGGGSGHLLRAVLETAPGAKGVLFDQPHVIEEASGIASERLRLQAGDFFRDEPPSCDAYLLMEIIHDWQDEEAAAILKAIRRAAPAHAKLLVIEAIVPDDPGPDWPKMLDIIMLTLFGSRQRTQQEYEALFAQSGFVLEREIDTRAGISILEARVA
ncbi:MAG: acetylserotonin O-methyltransferase [Actinomycetota bacterium]|nr:acetylserotonin O-methyltransferase [Actinomycetota bacterium]